MRMARVGHPTMWEAGGMGLQVGTHGAGDSGLLIKIAIFINRAIHNPKTYNHKLNTLCLQVSSSTFSKLSSSMFSLSFPH